MGAWGYKTFEDDTSLDLLDEWMESDSPLEDIRKAIEQALGDDEFDYQSGQVAASTAAIIEFALSPSTAPDLEDEAEGNERLSDWLLTLDPVELTDLIRPTLEAMDRLMSDNSELNELWSENEEEYFNWRSFHEGRRDRLMALTQPNQ